MNTCTLVLNEATENFLKQWRDKSLKLIDPFGKKIDTSKWVQYMPSYCDGSITMFFEDGEKETLKVNGHTILKKIDSEWITWYFIQ